MKLSTGSVDTYTLNQNGFCLPEKLLYLLPFSKQNIGILKIDVSCVTNIVKRLPISYIIIQITHYSLFSSALNNHSNLQSDSILQMMRIRRSEIPNEHLKRVVTNSRC